MMLSQIASFLSGELLGEDLEINGVSTIDEAGKDEITFLANPKYAHKALATKAGAILTAKKLDTDTPQVIVDDPYLGFARLIETFHPKKEHTPGVAQGAHVCAGATIDETACIYPNTYISENAVIGAGSVLFPGCFIGEGASVGCNTVLNPNVVVYKGCSVGDDCIIHAGVVIGSDGFGFSWDGTSHKKVPQVGVVAIGNHVEIGSNCTIDRAALTRTNIGNDVKIDNLVQVGHNVTIGDHTIIVAQTGIAGSSHIGRNVILAGQCGVTGHVTVGDRCTAASRTGIASDIPEGKVVSGYPAMDHMQWLRVQKVYKELPELLRRVRELERKCDEHD